MCARLIGISTILAAMCGLTVAADDTSTTTPPSATKAPTYITVGDIIGEITNVDANSVTIRVTWYTQPPPKIVNPKTNVNRNNNHYGNWHRGTSNRNSQQTYQHMIMMQQQLMRQRIQSQVQALQRSANAKPIEHHQDYQMNFATDATARIKHIAPKLDENGKPTVYTPQEYQDLKGNPNLPGYRTDLSALKVGQLVEAHIVRLPGSQNTKDKSDDMILRWALIINEDHVGKPLTTAKPAPKKK